MPGTFRIIAPVSHTRFEFTGAVDPATNRPAQVPVNYYGIGHRRCKSIGGDLIELTDDEIRNHFGNEARYRLDLVKGTWPDDRDRFDDEIDAVPEPSQFDILLAGTAAKVIEALDSFDPEDLKRIYRLESDGKNRKTILEAVEDAIDQLGG